MSKSPKTLVERANASATRNKFRRRKQLQKGTLLRADFFEDSDFEGFQEIDAEEIAETDVDLRMKPFGPPPSVDVPMYRL